MVTVNKKSIRLYVNELKEVGYRGYSEKGLPVLPEQFLQVLPSNCPSCGTPLVITESLSRLSCPSVSCGGKAVQRLLGMINDLGVLNMGESKCRAFFAYYGFQNPYALFAFNPLNADGTPATDGRQFLGVGVGEKVTLDIFQQVDKLRNMTLAEYVKIGNLPSIRDSALALFGGYDSLEQFYKEFEHGDDKGLSGVAFIQNRLGISNKNVSVRAIDITETLTLAKQELFEFIDYVSIIPLTNSFVDLGTGELIKATKKVFNICISRAVGGHYKSKQDFVNDIKQRFNSDVQINVLGGVSANCDVLIWSGVGAITSKVKQAERVNARYYEENPNAEEPKVLVLTGSEFIQYVENHITSSNMKSVTTNTEGG